MIVRILYEFQTVIWCLFIWGGGFRRTKEKLFLHILTRPALLKTKQPKDDDYIPQGVCEQESSRKPHTRSMGSPQSSQPSALGSSTEPESESSESPDEPDTLSILPKPKCQPRRPKQIVVKEKYYRICHGFT